MRIFVQFGTTDESRAAFLALNGRQFGGRTVCCCFYAVERFSIRDFEPSPKDPAMPHCLLLRNMATLSTLDEYLQVLQQRPWVQAVYPQAGVRGVVRSVRRLQGVAHPTVCRALVDLVTTNKRVWLVASQIGQTAIVFVVVMDDDFGLGWVGEVCRLAFKPGIWILSPLLSLNSTSVSPFSTQFQKTQVYAKKNQ